MQHKSQLNLLHRIKRTLFNILMYSECSMKPCIKAGRLDPGLYYLEVALSMDPNCLEALTSLARCQLLMGHWLDAMKVNESYSK